jgi:hypothetical protein
VSDLLFLAVTLGFFAVAVALVVGCERIVGGRRVAAGERGR